MLGRPTYKGLSNAGGPPKTASVLTVFFTRVPSHDVSAFYAHEVPLALKEFLRVLKPEGFLVVTCPDLQSAAKLIAEDKLLDPAYTSPAGPTSPPTILGKWARTNTQAIRHARAVCL